MVEIYAAEAIILLFTSQEYIVISLTTNLSCQNSWKQVLKTHFASLF